jgi:hypothetical protein
MKPSIVVRKLGPLLVARQSDQEPSAQNWGEFLRTLAAQCREFRAQELKILVCTDGGSPNTEQRALLAQALGNVHPRVALVSNNIKVRFVGALISLFQRNYRQFSLAEMDLAFAHLQLAPGQREFAEKTLRELEALLSLRPPH